MDFINVATVLEVAIKWAVYTALLWTMIKVQKLNYNTIGLFASSLAAILVDSIPFAGPYLSYVVLVIALWKCTGADIAPDCVFTVCIAGALMFCFNLWIIGLLLGPLRPDMAKAKPGDGDDTEMVDEGDDADEEPDEDEAPAETRPSKTAPKPSLSTSNSVRVAARPTAAPGSPAKPLAPSIESGLLTPKGVSYGANASVMISDGSRVYTVSRGESFTANLPQGRTRLKCDDITKTHVVLKTADGQVVNLKLP